MFSFFKSSPGKGKGKSREKEPKKLRASVQRRFEGRAREMEMGKEEHHSMHEGHEEQRQQRSQHYGSEHGEREHYRDVPGQGQHEQTYHGHGAPPSPSSPTGAATAQRARSYSYSSIDAGRMGNVHRNGNGRPERGHSVVERRGSGKVKERESVLSYQPSVRGRGQEKERTKGRREASPSPSMLVPGRVGGGSNTGKEEKGKEREKEKTRGNADTRAKEGRVIDETRRLMHQPSITVVNVNERVSPCIFRVDAYGVWKQAQARMGVDEEEEKEDREQKAIREAAKAGVVGTTENVLRLATFLAEEAESIVSLDVSARSMCVVASFRRDGWEQRIGVALGGR